MSCGVYNIYYSHSNHISPTSLSQCSIIQTVFWITLTCGSQGYWWCNGSHDGGAEKKFKGRQAAAIMDW